LSVNTWLLTVQNKGMEEKVSSCS